MRNNRGFSLIGMLVMVAIMSVITSGLCSLAAYSVRVSTTARIDSDILAHVSLLRSQLELNGLLNLNDTTVGQGWSVKKVFLTTKDVGTKTLNSYRVTFNRNPSSIIGPAVISREIGTIAIEKPKIVTEVLHDEKGSDRDNDRDNNNGHGNDLDGHDERESKNNKKDDGCDHK